jgi:hypothetical protein
VAEACRLCDGRKIATRWTAAGFEHGKPCKCGNGVQAEVKPSKGGNRRFFPKAQDTEEELTLEQQTRAFLRSRGH